MRFTLALHTDDGMKYGVTVPDLPGCFSAGDSLDEAFEMAREAIDLHCEGLAEEGLGIPSARPLSEHKADPLLADAVWVIVEAPVEKYLSKPIRLNVSLPEGLVRSIDAYAQAHHLTRSGFLAKAAKRPYALVEPASSPDEATRNPRVPAEIVASCLEVMLLGRVLELTNARAVAASVTASAHNLALADAAIYSMAQEHDATLWTQDIDYQGLPGVNYFAKCG